MAHTIETKLNGAQSAAIKPFRAAFKVRLFFVKILQTLIIWQERSEQRQALGQLGERMLKDIGISASDAYREMRKPFWLP